MTLTKLMNQRNPCLAAPDPVRATSSLEPFIFDQQAVKHTQDPQVNIDKVVIKKFLEKSNRKSRLDEDRAKSGLEPSFDE